MKTQPNLTELRTMASAITEAVSALVGKCEEAERCAFMADAIRAMCANAKADGVDALAQKLPPALGFLGESLPLSAREVQDETARVLRAVGAMQEAIGVPCDQLATVPLDAARAEAWEALSEYGYEASELAAVLGMLAELVSVGVVDEAARMRLAALYEQARALVAALEHGEQSPERYAAQAAKVEEILTTAGQLMGHSAQLDPVRAPRLWALDKFAWYMVGIFKREDGGSRHAETLGDLPGEHGNMANHIHSAAVEVEELASILDQTYYETTGAPILAHRMMFGRLQSLAGVILSALAGELHTAT